MYGFPRVLVDSDYKRLGPHLITPFEPDLVQPASIDVRLGREALVPVTELDRQPPLSVDLRTVNPAYMMRRETLEDSGYGLEPGTCLLVSTLERVSCPNDMICSVEGKSTIARCFVATHVTAGFIDPGFSGVVTLELVNHGPWRFVLRPGMRIAQLRFHWLGVAAERPYGSPGLGSRYQGAATVQAAEGPGRRSDER